MESEKGCNKRNSQTADVLKHGSHRESTDLEERSKRLRCPSSAIRFVKKLVGLGRALRDGVSHVALSGREDIGAQHASVLVAQLLLMVLLSINSHELVQLEAHSPSTKSPQTNTTIIAFGVIAEVEAFFV